MLEPFWRACWGQFCKAAGGPGAQDRTTTPSPEPPAASPHPLQASLTPAVLRWSPGAGREWWGGLGRGGGTHQRPAVDLDKHGACVGVVGAPLADAAGARAPKGAQGRGAQLGPQQRLHGGGRGGMGDRGRGDPGPGRSLAAAEAAVSCGGAWGERPADSHRRLRGAGAAGAETERERSPPAEGQAGRTLPGGRGRGQEERCDWGTAVGRCPPRAFAVWAPGPAGACSRPDLLAPKFPEPSLGLGPDLSHAAAPGTAQGGWPAPPGQVSQVHRRLGT